MPDVIYWPGWKKGSMHQESAHWVEGVVPAYHHQTHPTLVP
jgi:hypothetical protein